MKKISLIVVCIMAVFIAKAQYPTAVFYSELGERFTVYIDGTAQHQYMESNVKILDVVGTSHNVRISFENGFIDEINKPFTLENGTESSFMIHKKQGRYDISPKNQIPLAQASRAATGNAQTVVSFRGNNVNTNVNSSVSMNSGSTGNTGTVSMNVSVSESSSGGTTGTVSAHASSGGNVGTVSSNVGNTGTVSSNVSGGNRGTVTANSNSNNGTVSSNVSSNTGTVTATSSSNTGTVSSNVGGGTKGQVTATNKGGGNQNFHGIKTKGNLSTTNQSAGSGGGQTKTSIPGYNGKIGCSNPMSSSSFQQAIESVKSKNFSNAQLTVAKQIADANCLMVSQIKEIMKVFDFEEAKLEFARYAYKHACDIDNYYQVNDAFDFEGSIKSLDEYIKTNK